jgi:hypothetical protein
MKMIAALFKKVEYELPVFLILAVKLPVEQVGVYGFFYYALSLAAAFFLGGVIRQANGLGRNFVLVFAALFLAGDMTKTLFMPAYTVSSDIFLKAFSLLCFLAALTALRRSASGSHSTFFAWSIPVLCLVGTLAWPSFLFFYLPAVLILTAYENTGMEKDGSRFTFHAAWFFPALTAAGYAAYGYYTGTKPLGIVPFTFLFKLLPLRDILFALAAALPLIVILIPLWHLALRSAAGKKTRCLLGLCAAQPAVVLLFNFFAYYAVSDGWKYYIAAALFTQFCLLLYFIDAREKTVEAAFEKTAGFLLKNPFILLAILIYLVQSAQIFYPV